MKKSLFALAALTAVAGAAQAQSSVTLYGTLDASVQYVNNATATQNDAGVNDSAVASSVWGLKGSEDLGAGMKANFQFEGDLSIQNGNSNAAGLFRRAAFVGLSDGKLGALDLGLKMDPFIAAHGAIPVLGGNSVTTNLAIGSGYSTFFTRNAITYTMPTIAGVNGQFQYGTANNSDATLGGTTPGFAGGQTVAGSLSYTNNGLVVSTAYHHIGDASPAANSGSAAYFNSAAYSNIITYLASVKYTFGPLTGSYGYINNSSTYGVGSVNNMFSVGYAVNPKTTVGATYTNNSGGSTLLNLQSRYALSPRTTVWAQISSANNTSNTGAAVFNPVFTGNTGAVATAATGTTVTAYGVGVTHTF